MFGPRESARGARGAASRLGPRLSPAVSRSESDVVYKSYVTWEVLESQQTQAPFIHARISRAPLPRSRSPCTMGYCPRVPFAVSVDFPWGWPGLLPCLAPPLTCSLPLQPGFPRAPSMWSRPPPSRLLGSTHSTQCDMLLPACYTPSCLVRRSTNLRPSRPQPLPSPLSLPTQTSSGSHTACATA